MRISGLDFVRGIAVILVLFRHGTYECFLKDIGWAGVDLFFSMSGFLIASLVIQEYQSTGTFNAKLFLIRRGFKIYPAFYVFLIVTLLVNAIEHNLTYEIRFILAEIFFLQSYLPHVWTHTWSLAVEEHFYFALAVIAGFAIHKWNPLRKRSFFIVIFFLLLLIFAMRWLKCFPHRFEMEYAFFSTHVRMDGIITGVLAAYIWHYTEFKSTWKKYRFWMIAIIAIGLVPLCTLTAGSYEMNVFGISAMSISFGAIVLMASCWKSSHNLHSFFSWPFLIIAKIGVYSYSIYLWHMFVLQELYRFGFSSEVYNLVYLITAILAGILAARLIEQPFLKWREKFFPAKWKIKNVL